MEIDKTKDKKSRLRQEYIELSMVLIPFLILLCFIILATIRSKFYIEWYFYIGVLAISGWLGIIYVLYLLLKKKPKKYFGILFLIMIPTGLIFSLDLGYFLGYTVLLFFVYLMAGSLLLTIKQIKEIAMIIRSE